jgi:FKBP-type peptidyl-prolyl cis-trans isomerase 2
MSAVKSGDRVKVIYTICLENGSRFRPLHAGDTLEFTMGCDAVLPGFERALLAMSEGETRRVKVSAAEAYGPYRPERIFRLDRSEVLPKVEPLSIGDVVRVASSEEGDFFAVVRELTATDILLDANHPLCGQDVTFEIQLLEVSAPDSDPRVGSALAEAAPRRNGSLHAASGT